MNISKTIWWALDKDANLRRPLDGFCDPMTLTFDLKTIKLVGYPKDIPIPS